MLKSNEVVNKEKTKEISLKNTALSVPSRNKFTLDRLHYYRNLIGAMLSILNSRFIAKNPRPFVFSHMVTQRCNLNCDVCFWKNIPMEYELSLQEIQKVYADAQKEGYVNSILWGGEPLIRKDITEIAEASHKAGMYTKLATNGWFLTENHEFARYTDLMFTSIDDIGENHDIIRGNVKGLFERTINGINLIKIKYPKVRIYICSTVSSYSTETTMKNIAQLAKDLDILLYFTVNKSYQTFMDWQKHDNTDYEMENNQLSELFKVILDLKKQKYPVRNSYYFIDYLVNKKEYYECHWPQAATVMYANGDLLRCYDRKPMSSLNVRERSLSEVLKSQEFIDMVNACVNCKFSCVGNYAIDASGLWDFKWPAIKSIAEIAIN